MFGICCEQRAPLRAPPLPSQPTTCLQPLPGAPLSHLPPQLPARCPLPAHLVSLPRHALSSCCLRSPVPGARHWRGKEEQSPCPWGQGQCEQLDRHVQCKMTSAGTEVSPGCWGRREEGSAPAGPGKASTTRRCRLSCAQSGQAEEGRGGTFWWRRSMR